MNAKLNWTVARFIELAPRRAELGGNAAFRKTITHELSELFDGCSLASAANYYNQAKKIVSEQHPELVEGLGRSADAKKSGAHVRFPHSVVAPDGTVVAEGLSRAAARELVKSREADNLKVVAQDVQNSESANTEAVSNQEVDTAQPEPTVEVQFEDAPF